MYDGDSLGYKINCELSFIHQSDPSRNVAGLRENVNLREDQHFHLPNGGECPTRETFFRDPESGFLPGNTLTVRLRIWMSGGNLQVEDFITCNTLLESGPRGIMDWPMTFSDLELDHKEYTNMSVGDIIQLVMEFSFKGRDLGESRGCVTITNHPYLRDLILTAKLSLLRAEGGVGERRKTKSNFLQEFGENSLVFHNFVSRSSLVEYISLIFEISTILVENTIVENDHNHVAENLGNLNLNQNPNP